MGRRAMVEVSGLVAVAALFFGREAEAAVEGVQVQGTEVAGPGTRDPEVARMWQELEGAIEQGLPLALHTGSSNTTKFAMTPTTDCKGRCVAPNRALLPCSRASMELLPLITRARTSTEVFFSMSQPVQCSSVPS